MKKIFVLGGIVVVIVLGIGIFLLLSRDKKSTEPINADSIIPSPIAVQNPFSEKNVAAVYAYPEGAEVEKGGISTGGESEIITIAPEVFIEIQKKPYSSEIFEYMNNTMKLNGLTESPVRVGKALIPATEYKGALQLETPYQQLVTIFIVNKTIYKIQLMYFEQNPNLEYEAEYQKLLDSINLQ